MVFEKIKMLISDQFDVEEEEVTLESSIQDNLDADSLDFVELIMAIEDEFGVEIPDEDAEKFENVGSIVKYIERIR